jgi:hypothetical protein
VPHDRAIAQIAQPQLGLCTLDQLAQAGVSAASVDRRVRSGQLERRHAGVFAVAGTPCSWPSQVLAACLAAGPGAVASHRCAARLLGADLRIAVPLELAVARGSRPVPEGVVIHTSGDLSPEHVRAVGPVPCTTPERTLVDLGAVAPPWVVARALEQLVAFRRTTPASARATLDALARRGRRGVGVLRRILDERALGDHVSDSALEEAFARLCLRHRLPLPVAQYGLELGGRWRRLDFAYPGPRIAIEVDGYDVHSRRAVFEDDRARGNELEVEGWLLLRFTWRQITRTPADVARLVRAAHERRSSPPSPPSPQFS